MAKSQIIKDIANGTVSLTTTLKRALIIAHDLKNEKLEKWIKNELYGYDNPGETPPYRRIPGSLKISYGYGSSKVLNQPISSTVLPEDFKDTYIYKSWESISAIEKTVSEDGLLTVSLIELIPFLKTKKDPFVTIFDFVLELPKSAFKRIIDNVSREIMDILLKIDDEVGTLDSLDVVADFKQQNELNENINVHIDSFVNIGSNNDISKTNLAGKDFIEHDKKI